MSGADNGCDRPTPAGRAVAGKAGGVRHNTGDRQ